jgi:phage baseplate assembly protein W
MDVRGPQFPFAIDPASGGVAWSEGRDKLAENVRLILSTRHGERPMNREFGTRIHALLQEPNDGGLAQLVAKQVREVLMQAEPRIVVADIRFHQKGPELTLELEYIPVDTPRSEVMFVQLS